MGEQHIREKGDNVVHQVLAREFAVFEVDAHVTVQALITKVSSLKAELEAERAQRKAERQAAVQAAEQHAAEMVTARNKLTAVRGQIANDRQRSVQTDDMGASETLVKLKGEDFWDGTAFPVHEVAKYGARPCVQHDRIPTNARAPPLVLH